MYFELGRCYSMTNCVVMDESSQFLSSLFPVEWFLPEWPHGSLVYLRATLENNTWGLSLIENTVPGVLLQLLMDRRVRLHWIILSFQMQSKTELLTKTESGLCFLWAWAVAFPHNVTWHRVIHAATSIQEWAESGSCVLMVACVCSGHAVCREGCGDRQEAGFVLCKGGKFVLCLRAFISIALGHHKLCMWIWSPSENMGSRAGGTVLGAYRDCVACKMCLQHELDPQKVFLHCWLGCKIGVCWQKCHISPCTADLREETRWKHRSGRAGICIAQLSEVFFYMDQILMALTGHKSHGIFLYRQLTVPCPFCFCRASIPHLLFASPPHTSWCGAFWSLFLGWISQLLQGGLLYKLGKSRTIFSLSTVLFFACSPALAGWTWTSSARSCSTTVMSTRMGKFRNLN